MKSNRKLPTKTINSPQDEENDTGLDPGSRNK